LNLFVFLFYIFNSTAPNEVGEKCCDSADCNVPKLVSLVPIRKTPQFVTEPFVLDKPMPAINGFTTVFQLDGQAAKLSELKTPNNVSPQKQVYRIKPNTHVHVINITSLNNICINILCMAI